MREEPIVTICGRELKVQGRLLRIGRLEGDKYRFLNDPQIFIEGLRAKRCGIDLFTFMQRLPDTSPKYEYPMEWDNLAVISVSTFEHWWNQQIGFKARNKAKQAEKKGVVLREVPFGDALVKGIWEIYNETPIRQGKKFPHYGMSLERTREYASSFLDTSVFIGAFVGEHLIGFAKLTCDETLTQANLMHIVSMIEHRDKAPTNALIARAVRCCAERKIRYLVYTNFAYGNKQADSLSDFKERNGFKRVDLPRYYVPLTPVGWAAFRMGLHRRLIDRLPEPVISKLRDFRAAWYARKLQMSTT